MAAALSEGWESDIHASVVSWNRYEGQAGHREWRRVATASRRVRNTLLHLDHPWPV